MQWPLPFDPVSDAVTNVVSLPPRKYGAMSFPRGLSEPISREKLVDIKNGTLGIYVVGEIIYKDDLDNVRTTWFCLVWLVT
jgi:hypothetical protein